MIPGRRRDPKALTGNWRDEHLFVLRQSLAMYDDIAGHLAECDRKLQTLLSELGQRNVHLGKVPRCVLGRLHHDAVACSMDGGVTAAYWYGELAPK